MEEKYNDYELLYLISEGSEEAEKILYEKYSYLIWKRINAFKIKLRYRDDFYQEGLMCLSIAINSYCEYYEKSFNKYFDLILQRRYITLLKKDQSYFYEVTLIEDYDLIQNHLEEESDLSYEISLDKLNEYKDSLKGDYKYLSAKIEMLVKKNLKPKQIAFLLDCDIKKVYNEIYILKNKNIKKKEKN